MTHSPAPKPAGPGFDTLTRAVARSPLLTAAVVAAAGLTAAAVAVLLPVPKLTAYVLFRIPAAPPHVITPTERDDFNLFRQSQQALVKSRLVLNGALKQPAVADAVAALAPSRPDKVSALDDLLKVDFKTGPEFMRLYVEGDDPELILAVVNGVAEAYLSDVVNKKKTQQRDRRERLQALETDYTKKVEQTIKRLNTQLESQTTMSADESKLLSRERRARLYDERLKYEFELRQAQVEQGLAADEATVRAALMSATRERLTLDPGHQTRLEARAKVKADLEDARKRLAVGYTTPGVESLVRQLADLDAQVAAAEERAKGEVAVAATREVAQATAGLRAKADARVKFLQQMLARVDADEKELRVEGSKAAGDLYDTEGLKARLARERDTLSKMQQELTVIQLEADAPDRVSRLEADVVPGVESNKRVKYAGLAGLGVLAVGLAGVMARELRSPRVASDWQVAGELGLPMVGTLPALAAHGGPAAVVRAASDASLELHLPTIEAVTAASEVLRHGLDQDRPIRVLMVASAVGGEGKTTVALLLASALSRAGHRTLLIDGDLRRPNLHTHLGVAAGGGLCGLLTGDGPLADAVRPTEVPNLWLLPAGRWSRETSYALSSGRRWREVVEEAAAGFEYVILDSSPLLPVADGMLLARRVEGVLLTTLRGHSELPLLREAVRRLASIDKRVLGVVLNGANNRGYYTYPYSTRDVPEPELVPLVASRT